MTEGPYRLALLAILVMAVITAALLRRRLGRPGAGVPRSADQWPIALAIAIGGFCFYGGLLAFAAWPPLLAWSRMGLPAPARWGGVVILAAGVVLALWARFTLGRSSTLTAVPAPEAELVTTGPYRWLRHPIYSAGLLIVPGAGAVTDSGFVLGIGSALLLVLAVRTRREESLLLERFGDAYRRQMDRTGRWLPRWAHWSVSGSAEDVVHALEDHIDGVEGLITLRPADGKIMALVEDVGYRDAVCTALVALGVRPELFEVVSVGDVLIPYPNDDERLMAWFERAGQRPH